MEELDLIPVWKALADTKRRRIIQLLHENARTTSEISTCFDVSRFAIMRHLKVLEQAGLINSRREGRQRWNYLNQELFQQIQQTFLEKDGEGEYQLGEILSFLARQEGVREDEWGSFEQPSIEVEVALQASPAQVFQALTSGIDDWWSYRFVTDSHILLEPHVGGRLFEAFPDGGGVLYAFVTYLKPGEEIRLKGSMGLADDVANNIIHIVLQSIKPDATQLRLTHQFLGKVSIVTVDAFKRSWDELLIHHLKLYVEQGMHIRVLI